MLLIHLMTLARLGLCQEATDTSPAPSGGGPETTAPAAETAPPAETAPASETPPAAAASTAAPKVGLREGAKMLLQTTAQRVREVNTLKAQITTLTGERDAARAQVGQLETKLVELQNLLTNTQAENTQLKAAAQTIEDAFAEAGFPAAQLPAQAKSGSSPADTEEEIRERIAACRDPKESGLLVKKLRKLRSDSAAKTAAKN